VGVLSTQKIDMGGRLSRTDTPLVASGTWWWQLGFDPGNCCAEDACGWPVFVGATEHGGLFLRHGEEVVEDVPFAAGEGYAALAWA
jgi:hypothetical protein